MKIRIKFSKQGAMRFIGHLDIMRYFQKSMRRADTPIKYSEGFSPHQIMSFAAPLGIGLESTGEYLDIEVDDDAIDTLSSSAYVDMLNLVMADGMQVLEFLKLPDDAKNAMSIVAGADYKIKFIDTLSLLSQEDIENSISKIMAATSVVIEKETKKTTKLVDIKPFIYKLEYIDNCIFMNISQGSTDNLKPELVLKALAEYDENNVIKNNHYRIIRTEIYASEHKSMGAFAEVF